MDLWPCIKFSDCQQYGCFHCNVSHFPTKLNKIVFIVNYLDTLTGANLEQRFVAASWIFRNVFMGVHAEREISDCNPINPTFASVMITFSIFANHFHRSLFSCSWIWLHFIFLFFVMEVLVIEQFKIWDGLSFYLFAPTVTPTGPTTLLWKVVLKFLA